MCGIVAILGEDAVDRTIRGLCALEYRGYDSWGIVVRDDEGLSVDKDTGSVSKAAAADRFAEIPERPAALGHTRWATHGKVTQPNAHPHLSFDGRVAVVHNGVIENHLDLRRELEATGVVFASETDTEVIAHLIASELRSNGQDPLHSIGRAIARLDGEYAVGVMVLDQPDVLYGAKQKSPLLAAWNGERGILASDPVAVGGISSDVLYLEDGDLVRINRSGAEVLHREPGGEFEPAERTTTATVSAMEGPPSKGDYEHFMIKEINDVPATVIAAAEMSEEALRGAVPADARRLTLIGSGSAFYVARIGQYFFNRLARLSAHALPSDEALYWTEFADDDAVLAISQSGETFDALEVVRELRRVNAHLTSISNVPGSTLERMADHRLQQGSGPEICVLSTKSVISQVLILGRVALRAARDQGVIDEAEFQRREESIRRLPVTIRRLIDEQTEEIRDLAERYSAAVHWFFIGRGPLYPAALESALKFKEVSYKHAEGLPAGFFKHGTISLIDEDFHTVALLPSRQEGADRFHGTMANVSEIVARGGPVIGFGPTDIGADDRESFRAYVGLPFHDEDIADVVIHLVAGQLFAYYCALHLGREIDQPRSLAKSVTVR
ncbi:MAG TPA: glutamine--fructose-6-phosphate transaminase (isomerizing) [Solirubrobacteraceae bacterium]|jgi:glucosamine--fructose-6-phosphate aminotransferase (isomerizing)